MAIIVKPGPARGVALEGLKTKINGCLNEFAFLGQAVILQKKKKTAPAAHWERQAFVNNLCRARKAPRYF